MTKRNMLFLLATFTAAALYWTTLKTLATVSYGSGIYPYITVIPLLSAGLIYLDKERIFSSVRYETGIGFGIFMLALMIRSCSQWNSAKISPSGALSLDVLSFVVMWIGMFALCYGTKTLRAAAFQSSLLLLMVPLPQAFLERTIFILRGCSAQTAAFILRLGGVPVFQNGFRLLLPGCDVEVAEQCSGIRSGLTLFITSLLMGHLFLRTPWRRLWLVLAIFPVTIFKNGLRIVTIYGLTIHPSMESLTIWVHRYGGIPFSFLGLTLLALLVTSLRRFEETSTENRWIIGGGGRAREKAPDPTPNLIC